MNDSRVIGTTLFLVFDKMMFKYDLLSKEKDITKTMKSYFMKFPISKILETDSKNE